MNTSPQSVPVQVVPAFRPQDSDVLDSLLMKSGQLRAALMMVYGDGFEPFDRLNDTHKEMYLGMCTDIADEICSMVTQLVYAPAVARGMQMAGVTA